MNKLHSLVLAITLLVGSVSAVATAQDFNKGLEAAQSGDFTTRTTPVSSACKLQGSMSVNTNTKRPACKFFTINRGPNKSTPYRHQCVYLAIGLTLKFLSEKVLKS